MSRRSQKRKLKDGKHERAWQIYWEAYNKWLRREPPWWRIFAHYKWRCERPYKPKDADEYGALYEKYCYHRRWKLYGWR